MHATIYAAEYRNFPIYASTAALSLMSENYRQNWWRLKRTSTLVGSITAVPEYLTVSLLIAIGKYGGLLHNPKESSGL